MATEIEEDLVTKDGVVHKHTHKHMHKQKAEKMSEPVNVFAGQPMMGGFGGGDGFGLGGGGMIGGLLVGALLGRGGFGGFGGVEGRGFGGESISGLNNLQGAIDTNIILQSLGDIKAAVPLAESQVQLALAGSTSDITSQQLQQTIALQNQGFNAQLATQASFANTGDKIDNLQASMALAVATNQFNCVQATMADGEKTRDLISSIDRDNLNRLITTQANEITELRNERNRDGDRHGLEINMINNQNQNQMQFQQQAQALNTLAHGLVEIGQIARATNSNVIVGNTGASTTGAQTASPTNVRA
jgi:hypothetical protein